MQIITTVSDILPVHDEFNTKKKNYLPENFKNAINWSNRFHVA